ncbi:MAG: hypothetical protein IPK72_19950 [Candidatus Eisenbacteria bacterium]|nr:hypothetical protein [Candidatus Eisenbacteria bacterium]
MDTIATFPAGGAAKNREVQSYVVLDPGSYNLCYATDDSHAYDDWNDEPPYDSDLWGIQLLPLGDSAAGQVVPAPTSSGASGTDQTMISLAPAKDGQHVVKRFTSEGTTNVLLICVGEGVGDEMADYGWLENLDTGKTVWEMSLEESWWAGGAKKNREIRVALKLPPAKYALHYETDDSHAFGDWNAAPPRQPHLWGITLIELPPGSKYTYTPRHKREAPLDEDGKDWDVDPDAAHEKYQRLLEKLQEKKNR